MRKKPGIVLLGMMAQTAISVVLIGAAVFFLFLTYTVGDSAGAAQFKLSLITILPLAVAALVASWGMLKRRAWGWWTGLVANFLALLTMIPDFVQRDPAPDREDVAGVVIFLLAVALFLPSRVRQYYLRTGEMREEIGSKATG